MSRIRRAPSVFKIGGVALRVPRSLARAVWLATGVEPQGTAPAKVDRTVVDPLATQQAADIRAVFAKCEVDVTLTGALVGPRVVRYRVKPGLTTRVEKVEKCAQELRVAMGTKKVGILSPIPGEKGLLGVEVPRADPQDVPFAEVLASITDPHPLVVALGRDMTGASVTPNLEKTPHLLVAGQTGAGKSACLNAILVSILKRATPEQVKLLLIDPKKVELTPYESVPHLVTPIVTDAKAAASALEWVTKEMDRRYDRLVEAKCRNITEYNAAHPGEPIPFLVVVVDELGDLIVVAKEDVEAHITRITQLSRAAGIHLVLATQRPSTDIITGVIKANLPSRLAFAVASGTDSRVILDANGAETLLGEGDGLLSYRGGEPERFQGSWVSDEDIAAAVAGAGSPVEAPSITAPGTEVGDDPLLKRAIALVIRERTASVAQLQKGLRVGHKKAKDLIELMERRGIVGPFRGNAPREVLAEFE